MTMEHQHRNGTMRWQTNFIRIQIHKQVWRLNKHRNKMGWNEFEVWTVNKKQYETGWNEFSACFAWGDAGKRNGRTAHNCPLTTTLIVTRLWRHLIGKMEGKRNRRTFKMKERGLELSSLDAWEGGEALGGRLAGGDWSAATKRCNDDYPKMEPFASREILRVQELDGGKWMLRRHI
jgi:hypothetical protein